MSYKMYGHVQYLTQAEADACETYLTGWAAAHSASIYSHPGLTNGHSQHPLDPPSTGGCTVQVDYEYHFDMTADEMAVFQEEVERSVLTLVGTALCDSEAGTVTDA